MSRSKQPPGSHSRPHKAPGPLPPANPAQPSSPADGGASPPRAAASAGFMGDDDFIASRAEEPTAKESQPAAYPLVRVAFNSRKAELASVESDKLRPAAMNWSRVVRNRARWAGAKSSSQQLNQECRKQLNELGITDAQLDLIAEVDLLEVSIPNTAEEIGWEARIFPWEYVINAAVKQSREGPPLTIIRHIRRDPAPPANVAPAALKVLYVQAVPAALEDWDFTREQDRVISSLTAPGQGAEQIPPVINPDLATLTQKVSESAPGVIHFAGFDTHQAAVLMPRSGDQPLLDGVVLCEGEARERVEIDAETIAKAMTAASPPPQLVGFNTYYSASRVAARTVANGALAAVGFQDVIDDELAELFYSNFYLAWGLSGRDSLWAFLQAQEFLKASSQSLTGSGIVLWRSQSIVDEPATPSSRTPSKSRVNVSSGVVFTGTGTGTGSGGSASGATGAATAGTGTSTGTGGGAGGAEPASTGTASGTGSGLWNAKWGKLFRRDPSVFPTARDIFLFDDVKPFEKLNYSLLHNNRGLFEKFVLKRAAGVNGRISGLQLRVEMQAGGSSPAYYQRSFDMVESLTPNLHAQIHVPLVSEFLRSLRHTLKTNIYVKIELGDEIVFDETYTVDLLAVDEWLDTDSDRTLLPSFVLPGDPVVPRIVDAAQRYLVALRDDAGAGFDGYQALDQAPDDPDQVVDAQVRAIWTALGQDFAVKYINPPPTYTKDSQRLRTPSDMIEGRRGTCIDLALLMMACLEYIDIHPVIFLLDGHAFPGYWRSSSAQMEFVTRLATNSHQAPGPGEMVAPDEGEPWCFGKSSYGAIVELIRSGVLVPLETVWLTKNRGFWEAVEQGNDNLHDPVQFDSMMDLWLARDHGVTPLPILAEVR